MQSGLKGKSLSVLVVSIRFAYQYLDVIGKMLWQGGRKSEVFVWAGRAASSLWSGWRIGQVGWDSQKGKCRFGMRSEFWQQFNHTLSDKTAVFDSDWPDRRLVLQWESAGSIPDTTESRHFSCLSAPPKHLQITVLLKKNKPGRLKSVCVGETLGKWRTSYIVFEDWGCLLS